VNGVHNEGTKRTGTNGETMLTVIHAELETWMTASIVPSYVSVYSVSSL